MAIGTLAAVFGVVFLLVGVSGFFASRCGLPHIPDAPGVRDFQKRQLTAVLPWMCRSLGLPQPAGR